MGNANQPDEPPADGKGMTPIPANAEGSTGAALDRKALWSRLLSWGSKVCLTILAVVVLLSSLKLAIVAHAFLATTQQTPPPLYIGSAPHPAESSDFVPVPWPEFPHGSPRRVRTSVINGVRTIIDSWSTGAEVSDVLAYFRDQMSARGWRDVTEETYSLQTESHRNLDDAAAERFATNYRKIMESTLVMSSGQWTMHIVAAPARQQIQNRVEIYAVEASSMKEFSDSLQTSLSPNAAQPLEVLRRGNGQLYRTTVTSKDQPTTESFRQELGELEAQGWRSLILLPSQSRHPGEFAWLVKGEAYMALSVSPLGGQDRCSVMLTQVTPDSPGAGH